MIDYYLSHNTKDVKLEILDNSKNIVRTCSSADIPEPVNEKELRIPTYWIRPSMVVSATKGIHRFIWDLHYAPPESLPPSYPIAAVAHNTASQPQGPWAQPGTYTVRLIADGREMLQPLTIKMDPRVSLSQDILKQQSDLSMTCYNGLHEVHQAIEQIHKLRQLIRGLDEKTSEKMLKDTLSAFDKKVESLEGGDPPQDVEIMYFSVEGGKQVKETFSGLQTKLLYVMTLLQSANAQPTDVQVTAVHDEQHVLNAMLQRWETFKKSDLPEFNSVLKQHGLEMLKME
jgi:hypothetical protein